MSYICGGNSVTSVDAANMPADLAILARPRPTGPDGNRQRVVPDLYRDVINTLAAVALFPLTLVAVLAVQRQDRKTGGTR